MLLQWLQTPSRLLQLITEHRLQFADVSGYVRLLVHTCFALFQTQVQSLVNVEASIISYKHAHRVVGCSSDVIIRVDSTTRQCFHL